MSSCATLPANAPVISITLAGLGEPLLRMEKRLSCAAGGLGIRLDMDIRKDADALGLALQQTPAVLHDGKVIFSGLHRTEEIEVWLKKLI
jgi:hypothetical protein